MVLLFWLVGISIVMEKTLIVVDRLPVFLFFCSGVYIAVVSTSLLVYNPPSGLEWFFQSFVRMETERNLMVGHQLS